MSPLARYVDAWVAGDADRIEAAVSDTCVIAECWGPEYRGRGTVRRWADAWFAAGGVVHRWDLTDHLVDGEREAATWTFAYTWRGRTDLVEGASIAHSDGGTIVRLREFRTTAPAYDWNGTWR